MRILLTTDTIGGVWTFSRELVEQLLGFGHAIALVSFGREPSPEQQAWLLRMNARHAGDFMWKASAAPLEWMEGNAPSYEAGAQLLLKVAKDFEPDIFHSNQYCFGKLPIDVPRLITAHSDVLSWAVACRPGGLPASAWLDRYRVMVQQGVDAADAVVAPTRWMLEALHAHFKVRCRGAVIYNGRTPLSSELPAERRLQGVSVGRLWDEAKSVATLTRINAPIPLIVAGEDKLDGARVRGEYNHLHCLGSLTEDALFTLFGSSSIYIATSIYEPFGLAPLEAALCGCAVVARDLPSLREVWRDAATYFNDERELERVLLSLAKNATVLESARKVSIARAASYTAERMANAHVKLYQELLASKHEALHPGEQECASDAA